MQVAGATLAVVSAAGEVTPLKTSYYTFGNISAREVQASAPLPPSRVHRYTYVDASLQ